MGSVMARTGLVRGDLLGEAKGEHAGARADGLARGRGWPARGTAAAVDGAIAEAFVAGFRVAMFVAADLALLSALAAAFIIEGKGSAARTQGVGRPEAEAAPA